MAAYVDGFLLAVPKRTSRPSADRAQGRQIWRELARRLRVRRRRREAGQGHIVPAGVALKSGETVVFSWITFKSRAHRDRVNAKVMKDPRLTGMMDPSAMPFDGQRMIYGGFQVLVDL